MAAFPLDPDRSDAAGGRARRSVLAAKRRLAAQGADLAVELLPAPRHLRFGAPVLREPSRGVGLHALDAREEVDALVEAAVPKKIPVTA